ncbi:MAG: Na(+)/H(+) antiporter NhaD [Candidatus Anoxychlamydiales bacterium]|nr:Na(+)/H(+) antiporter NhaD [Candidatus Anoxychlamydiales bacterium]
MNAIHSTITAFFIIGYLAIIFEFYIKVNKTASALLMAVFTWVCLFFEKDSFQELFRNEVQSHIADASQIIFFLIGAMTLVELIDSHNGFKMITNLIAVKSKRKLLWIIAAISFFLSAVLDNLTTTIVMISILRKLLPEPSDRRLLGATVVVAANAGGAWTPIGDVTTTMLWIKGNLTTLSVMKSLFLPSVFSIVVTLVLLGLKLDGKFSINKKRLKNAKTEPGAKIVLSLGILALVFVPIFRSITKLPPFFGMFVGLAVLWIVTDAMHHKHESRHHLRIPYVLAKIDISGVLFFLGILLAINSLEMTGILKNLAVFLDVHIGNLAVVATVIGFLSAIVDNVPLVAATIGMYDLSSYPPDSALWQMIAYAAGTGGSILLIGSAAGVALMGLEKIDFIWYMKRISIVALTGYLAGMALYLLLNGIYI